MIPYIPIGYPVRIFEKKVRLTLFCWKSKCRAAQSAGAREQKGYLLPGTNQNVAGTIWKERGRLKMKNSEENREIKNSTDFRVFLSNRSHFHRQLCSRVFPKIVKIFNGQCGIVFGFCREASIRRKILVDCSWFFLCYWFQRYRIRLCRNLNLFF